jgi:hypothetical protein
MLEILDFALVFFGGLFCGECAKVAALPRFGIYFSRVYTVFS